MMQPVKVLDVKPGKFGHNQVFKYDEMQVITSYHPSRQNTQTGRLLLERLACSFQKSKKIMYIVT